MAYISKCKHGKYIAMCDDCYPKTKLQQGWEKGYAEMNKQHKWHKEIKAWADGGEVECRFADPEEEDKWQVIHDPSWNDEEFEFRIKPQPKEPQYLYVYQLGFEYKLASAKEVTMKFQSGDRPYEFNYIGKIKLEDESE